MTEETLVYGLKRLPVTVFFISDITLTPSRAVRLYDQEKGSLSTPL
jgi:hypothetical protein